MNKKNKRIRRTNNAEAGKKTVKFSLDDEEE